MFVCWLEFVVRFYVMCIYRVVLCIIVLRATT